MRVAIAGGHGKIGLALARLLSERGDEPLSLIRNPAHEPDVREAGGTPVHIDLEAQSAPQLISALEPIDAVVFAAGAGPGSGAERKETVDHRGAVKLIEAARALAIQRYLMVSSMGANPDHPGEEVFDAYLRAKGRADAALRASRLTHTIVRPGRLTDDEPAGAVEAGAAVPRGEVSRADVAAVLLACLDDERSTANRTFEVVGGSTPIADAVAAVSSLPVEDPPD